MTNKLGSSNPNRIPQPVNKMLKNIKFYNLIRETYRIEREFLANIPWELLDMKWDETATWEDIKKMAEGNLSIEHRLELDRIRLERKNVWVEFKNLLTPEEYEKWIEESLSLKHQQGIGNVVLGGNPESMIDILPIVYCVLNHLPIDEGTKNEKYRVEVNGVETTLSYDCYSVMEHIREHYQKKKFHFKNLLYDLEINKKIHKDYDGKANLLFRQRPELLEYLFTPLKSPRGYWICNVDYWGD